ncbi:hypothetical protein [Kaistella polysaccharea]|uniref:hypothetical protein n=1 Tax=Kaistella polysaccharea TaxID=2878534 RepID=UPI001CF4D883|nr:hypothetical protein [Kaistella polysaccharea]
MKKTFLYLAIASVTFNSCRKDENVAAPEVSIETQNSYDDQATAAYLQNHYLDAKGNVQFLAESDKTNIKLADLNPVTLPSGVVYIIRNGAQPEPGTVIGDTDILSLMHNTVTFVATNTDNKVEFTSPYPFRNTIAGTGTPEIDPLYYFAKESVRNAAKDDLQKQRSFYEIEGFREALQKFKAFNLEVDSNYNLQGLIIVPSRAAFARDAHYNYTGIGFKDRSFIFNFQVYKSTPAPATR